MEMNSKLREACANIAEYARSAMSHTEDAHVLGYLNQIEGWAKAALAAPARNCDIYATVEEARKVWCGTPSRDWDYLCDWLFATTKEMEVSDGSK